MRKLYYLSTCDTCKRLLKDWKLDDSFQKIDLKKDPINANDLQELYVRTRSYESLFNKRARLLRERGLKAKDLKEADFKSLLLEHYSFLARPIVLIGDRIFIGNSKANSEALITYLKGL